MKLILLSSIALALIAAIPVQDEISVAEIAVAEVPAGGEEVSQAAEAAVEEEAPAFLLGDGAKGRGGRCVRRFASSSSSSDSCDCCEQCNKVYYDWLDFYTNTPNFDLATGTWTYFNLTGGEGGVYYIANNGTLITGCSGGILDTKVYKTWQDGLSSNPYEDHAKYWAYAKTPIPIPPHGDAVVKWAANVQTFNTEENPFPSAIVERNDYRLASGQFTAFDPSTALNFGFVVTNHRVYLLYQRSPFLYQADIELTKGADQAFLFSGAGFTFLIPVKIRRTCDWNDLAVIFHGDSKEVSYHVDDQEVFVINQVGYLLDREYMVEDFGGVEAKLWPESIYYGFGSFTDLDWYPACQRTESCRACRYPFIREALVKLYDETGEGSPQQYNPIFGPNVPEVYWDNTSNNAYKVWGQGSVTKIRKLIAYQRLPVC